MTSAEIVYPTYELLDIAKLARSHIHMIMVVLGWIAAPLALLPPIPISWRWIWIRVLLITIVIWLIRMEFRTYSFTWSRIVMDIEQRDSGYDGVGGNVSLLLFGWIEPFVLSLVAILVARFVLRKIAKTKKA